MYYFMHQQHMNRPILWIIGLGKVKEDMAQAKKRLWNEWELTTRMKENIISNNELYQMDETLIFFWVNL
jgi:hypothetical protein